jgi:hypothetical protein
MGDCSGRGFLYAVPDRRLFVAVMALHERMNDKRLPSKSVPDVIRRPGSGEI